MWWRKRLTQKERSRACCSCSSPGRRWRPCSGRWSPPPCCLCSPWSRTRTSPSSSSCTRHWRSLLTSDLDCLQRRERCSSLPDNEKPVFSNLKWRFPRHLIVVGVPAPHALHAGGGATGSGVTGDGSDTRHLVSGTGRLLQLTLSVSEGPSSTVFRAGLTIVAAIIWCPVKWDTKLELLQNL